MYIYIYIHTYIHTETNKNPTELTPPSRPTARLVRGTPECRHSVRHIRRTTTRCRGLERCNVRRISIYCFSSKIY